MTRTIYHKDLYQPYHMFYGNVRPPVWDMVHTVLGCYVVKVVGETLEDRGVDLSDKVLYCEVYGVDVRLWFRSWTT